MSEAVFIPPPKIWPLAAPKTRKFRYFLVPPILCSRSRARIPRVNRKLDLQWHPEIPGHPEYPVKWNIWAEFPVEIRTSSTSWLSQISEADSEIPSQWNLQAEFPVEVRTTFSSFLSQIWSGFLVTRKFQVNEISELIFRFESEPLPTFSLATFLVEIGDPEFPILEIYGSNIPVLGRIPETLFLCILALGYVICNSHKLKYLAIGLVYHWYC